MSLTKEKNRILRNAYTDAKRRCESEKSPRYKYYGARGIEFKFNSFEEFFAELGEKPKPSYSLDRIDNDGHYEAGNVRWASKSEQVSNRRSYEKLWLDGNSNRAKSYAVFHPSGEKESITNMAKFCREHGLDKANLHATTRNGRVKTHKGYRAEVA